MAALFKKQFTKPLPDDASIVNRKGKQIAQWKDRKGKARSAEVTTGKDGSQRIKTEAKKWYVKYRDGEGIVQEVATGCTDKDAATSVMNDLTTRAQHVKAKIMSPEQDRIADHQQTPLSEHVGAFLEYQRQKGTHPDRVQHYETKLHETADACRFRFLCDLSVDRLERWLSEQRKGERDMGAAVYNGYRESWLAFGNWCIGKRTSRKQTHFNGEKRLLVNPFDGMAKVNTEAERRRKARALTEGELTKLLEAARTRPLIHAMTVYRGENKGKLLAKVSDDRKAKLEKLGQERAMIYKAGVLTGLRADELRTLSVNDLSFGDVPFVKLRHSNEKNRKGSTIPLRSDLATELKAWVKDKKPTDRVFYVAAGLLRIMNRDIEAAGIPKIDDDGYVVHVHALRHSFGTHLSLANVAPRTAQAAMRHSNISLTMGTYTDSRLLDTAAAVESLPMLRLPVVTPAETTQIAENDATDAELAERLHQNPESENDFDDNRLGKTRDESDETTPRTLAPTLAPNVVLGGHKQSIPDHSDGQRDDATGHEKTRKTLGFTGVSVMGNTELESVTSTMSTWRSNQLS